jgi:3-hydroxyacyl-CoA dehydrogenase/3a,7a,12a-trihydroxy-5b-cholest-24-enoyl-CoA hydratase
VKTAVDAFGTVDIIINNAGILRDVSFQKMSDLDWDLIMKVHLKGTFSVTRAAWNIMREKGYGRIINTASSSGLYGSFGQVNYSTAKMGIHGFTQSLAKEGEKRNIKVNTICPIAGTRMTETVMPKELVDALKPEYITHLVAVLAHDKCPESGQLYDVGAGAIGKFRWNRSAGIVFPLNKSSPEAVLQNFEKIVDFSKDSTYPESNDELMAKIMNNIELSQKQ